MDLLSLMAIPRDQLGQGTTVRVRVLGDADSLARDMAEAMASEIRASHREDRGTCLIVPVGPIGQYPYLARIIAEERLDCSRVTFINMDEFLDDDGGWIDAKHPLSFRGFMERGFYSLLPAGAGFRPENRIFPNPKNLDRVAEIVAERGGVDACFGGIGLNGHIAFNEPEAVPVEVFAGRPTRVVTLAPESQAHMAVNLSCIPELVPRRAVTVGMREILGARRLRLYANRTWQRGVVRLALHGPISPSCPASYLRYHPDAELVLADYVAEAAEVRLQ
ncbi:MAG: glucosamine-6-phosphate isomerase [Isosphaeraceae bacterium]|nr:glucosamine-6-phosphate isomerase [Isosphaeraceae bacterium]